MKNYIYLLGVKIKMKWYDLFNIPKASLVLLINKEGKILSVSRKDNHLDKNICGGKVDKGETFEAAAIRECFEETGLRIFNLKPVFFRKDGKYKCVTYLADYTGEISSKEAGVVGWIVYNDILTGSFGEYNRELKTKLTKLGIKLA